MNRLRQSDGFTLIEVLIAVAVLGVALVTLLTVQTGFLKQYSRDRNLTKAALYAQYLMATLYETRQTPPDVKTKDGELIDALEDAGYFGEEDLLEQRQEFKEWRYRSEVTSIDYPPFEDVMRRIDITVQWGDEAGESYHLVYFVKK